MYVFGGIVFGRESKITTVYRISVNMAVTMIHNYALRLKI